MVENVAAVSAASVYRQLAEHLDWMPHRFPATESGAELRLLAKIFTIEEATLATAMSLRLEPAEVIAERSGTDRQVAYQRLKGMARKGLVRTGRQDRQLAFALLPFVVGFYEEQLPRMDVELATLFEEYFLETRGALGRYGPAVNRIIPVEEAIPAGVEIYPYERASELLSQAKAWGVRECICRLQQKLVGKGCDHPLENCLSFAPVEGVFDHSDTTRAITKEEALRLLHEAEDAGLVHSPGNYQDGHFYICNCCTCCCGVLRSIAEFSVPTAIAKAGFWAVVDEDLCAGCGDCLARCQFKALAVIDDLCQVDALGCVGCGLCVTVCPTEALRLERRPAGEMVPPPVDIYDWAAQRARQREMGR